MEKGGGDFFKPTLLRTKRSKKLTHTTVKAFYSEKHNRLFNTCEKFTYLSTLSFNDGSKTEMRQEKKWNRSITLKL